MSILNGIGVAAAVALLSITTAHAQTTKFVDDDAPTGGNGASWETAFTSLQDALAATTPDSVIWVAAGIYRPDDGAGQTPGDRAATFQLIGNFEIYGGFAGDEDPALFDLDDRDFANHETILNGDLAGDDQPIACTPGSSICGTVEDSCIDGFCTLKRNIIDNSTHVVTIEGSDATGIIDGFTISGGNAGVGNLGIQLGGGMRIADSSPTVRNCLFDRNAARAYGGGMDIFNGSPHVVSCTFRNNVASFGGGLADRHGTTTLTNCAFTGNFASLWGGAIDSSGSITLTGCTLSRNSALVGGGIYSWGQGSTVLTDSWVDRNAAIAGGGLYVGEDSFATLNNCLFSENQADDVGGGLYLDYCDGAEVAVANCSFVDNHAVTEDGATSTLSNAIFTDCIFWDNTPITEVSLSAYYFCDIQGGLPAKAFDGGGNIDLDPIFVPGPSGCYYLSQTAAGQAVQSPCVDSGSDTASSVGLDTMTTRSDEHADIGIIDMGYHHTVTGELLVMGDYNRNGERDLIDWSHLQSCFTGTATIEVPPCCRIFDFEFDADIDLDDYTAFQETTPNSQ